MAVKFEESDEIVLKNVRLDYHDIYKPAPSMEERKKDDRKFDKYKVKAIIEMESDAHKAARAGMIAAAKKMWPDNYAAVLQSMATNNKALRKGDEYLKEDGSARTEYKGNMFISASNGHLNKPKVVGPKRVFVGPTGEYTTTDTGKLAFIDIAEDGSAWVNSRRLENPPYKITVPYRGCNVNLKVKFVSGKAGKMDSGEAVPNQVFARILAVQFVKDNTAFGPAQSTADGFGDEDVEDGEDLFGDGGATDTKKGQDFGDDDIPF